MNFKLKTKAKNDFDKDFDKLMNNSVFRNTVDNIRKHRYVILIIADKRKSYLMSEPNYHATK